GPLAGASFLGPPLPLEGRLFALVEGAGELRLVTLERTTGRVLDSRTLGALRGPLGDRLARRADAAHLGYPDGVLIVPTNAGPPFAVDVVTGGLLWACPYRGRDDEPPGPGTAPGRDAPPPRHWLVTPPVIAGDRVVFAAPDSRGLLCVRLRDGAL